MKSTLTFFIVIMCSIMTYGQSNSKKHYVGLNFLQPVMVSSMKQFHNDDWILTQGTNYHRDYLSVGLGLEYNYILPDNYFISFRPSVSIRRVDEANKEDFYCNICGELDSIHTTEKFNYKQEHFNAFLGFGYIAIFKKLEIKTSIDLAYIYYSKGRNIYETSQLQIMNNPPDIINVDNNSKSDMLISNGISFGLGATISVQYNILKNLKIGFSISDYLLWTRFKNNTVTTYTEKTFYERTFYGEPQDINTNTSVEYVTKENFKQTSFSRVVPQLTIGWTF